MNLLLAILIGEKDALSRETITEFQNSSLIHILCVSGAHVSFFLLCVQKVCQNLGRNRKYVISLFMVILLFGITGFSASVARACLMGGMMILGKLWFRRADIVTTISVSLFVLLLYKPFVLFDTGLLLSYGGTIGILIFSKILEENIPKNCGKLTLYILKTVVVSFAAQLVLAPIIAYFFQSFHPTFFFSSLLATPLFEAILAIGYLFLVLAYVFPPIGIPLAGILNLLLTLFTKIAEMSSKLPFSHSKVTQPGILFLMMYYCFLLLGRYWYLLYQKQVILRYFERKQKEMLHHVKEKITMKKLVSGIAIVILLFQMIQLLPGEFSIYFIDVGQGDSTLIQTKNHKTIMIDSGGQEDLEKYDVGKQVLVPYLLARGIKKIDYILISHFHADHCNGFLSLMEELQVGTLLIAKQENLSKEAEQIVTLAKQKKIKILYVQKGQVISLDKETKLEILYIGEDTENLNNNSIIVKVSYHQFSILFTGDAEESEEKAFLKEYAKQNITADILKVGHHGSPTSSTQEFLNAVKPKIALIGVGENNSYGHPSAAVLERLTKLGTKIYRTDQMGEIVIKVKSNRAVRVETKLSYSSKTR